MDGIMKLSASTIVCKSLVRAWPDYSRLRNSPERDGTKPGLWTHGLDRGLDYGLDHGPKIDSILGM